MKEEIQTVIKEHLPQQIGEVLQKRLSELERTEQDYVALKDEFHIKVQDWKVARKKIGELSADLGHAGNLSERELEVSMRERNMKIFELEEKVKASVFVNDRVMGFVDSLMRNTVFKEDCVLSHTQEYGLNGETRQVETGRNVTRTHE